jgi:hypothetical protein
VTRSLHGTLGCGSKAATWACGTLLGRISWSVGWTGGEPTGNTSKVRSGRSLRVSRGNPESTPTISKITGKVMDNGSFATTTKQGSPPRAANEV